jgi:crotonobetainyl-CoA:carnitine CoA-transferase CaiB-like acyl-CoA transferase
VVLGAIGSAWVRLLRDVMERPDLLDTPRVTDTDAYNAHANRVVEEVRTWMGPRARDDVAALLDEHRVPNEPVRDLGEIWDDPQLEARDMFWEYEYAPLGKIRTIGSPIHLSKTPPAFRLPPPQCGEHNTEVLEEVLHYDEERISELAVSGVLEGYEE